MKNNNLDKLNKSVDKQNKLMKILFISVVLFWIIAIAFIIYNK